MKTSLADRFFALPLVALGAIFFTVGAPGAGASSLLIQGGTVIDGPGVLAPVRRSGNDMEWTGPCKSLAFRFAWLSETLSRNQYKGRHGRCTVVAGTPCSR